MHGSSWARQSLRHEAGAGGAGAGVGRVGEPPRKASGNGLIPARSPGSQSSNSSHWQRRQPQRSFDRAFDRDNGRNGDRGQEKDKDSSSPPAAAAAAAAARLSWSSLPSRSSTSRSASAAIGSSSLRRLPPGVHAVRLEEELDGPGSGPWVADHLAATHWSSATCMRCQAPWTWRRWRHHCRKCGAVVCHACSANTAFLWGQKKPSRVCSVCFDELKHGKSSAAHGSESARGAGRATIMDSTVVRLIQKFQRRRLRPWMYILRPFSAWFARRGSIRPVSGTEYPSQDPAPSGNGNAAHDEIAPAANASVTSQARGTIDDVQSRPGFGELYVKVVAGRHLPAADWWTSDPYVRLRLGHSGEVVRTHHIRRTRNPWWDRPFLMEVANATATLFLEVWDHDLVGSHTLLGSVEVPLWTIAHGKPIDLWFDLHLEKRFVNELRRTQRVRRRRSLGDEADDGFGHSAGHHLSHEKPDEIVPAIRRHVSSRDRALDDSAARLHARRSAKNGRMRSRPGDAHRDHHLGDSHSIVSAQNSPASALRQRLKTSRDVPSIRLQLQYSFDKTGAWASYLDPDVPPTPPPVEFDIDTAWVVVTRILALIGEIVEVINVCTEVVSWKRPYWAALVLSVLLASWWHPWLILLALQMLLLRHIAMYYIRKGLYRSRHFGRSERRAHWSPRGHRLSSSSRNRMSRPRNGISPLRQNPSPDSDVVVVGAAQLVRPNALAQSADAAVPLHQADSAHSPAALESKRRDSALLTGEVPNSNAMDTHSPKSEAAHINSLIAALANTSLRRHKPMLTVVQNVLIVIADATDAIKASLNWEYPHITRAVLLSLCGSIIYSLIRSPTELLIAGLILLMIIFSIPSQFAIWLISGNLAWIRRKSPILPPADALRRRRRRSKANPLRARKQAAEASQPISKVPLQPPKRSWW